MRRKTVTTLLIMFCAAVTIAAQNFNVEPALRKHIEYLSSDELQGRKAGSAGEKAAAEYIFRQMENAGVQMLCTAQGQDFSIDKDGASVASRNILGIVEGYDSRLRNEYIVVGAHMDNMGTTDITVNGRKMQRIYPGADDNASGVAALLEVARLTAANSWLFPRSVIFVAFGAGECGTAGSWYFANRAFGEMASVRAMVNLDMLGRGNDKNPFRVYSSLPPRALDTLKERTLEKQAVTSPAPLNGTVQSSDHMPFYQKGIPVVLFTTGMTREYHSVEDKPSLILYRNLERECNYIFNFILSAAEAGQEVYGREEIAKVNPDDVIYSVADCDKRPQFFHSTEKHFLDSWVYKYVRYPQEAVAQGIHGRVMVSFIVEKDGSVTNVEVESGVHELLDAEAVRVIKVSPKWIPGKVKDRAVRTRIVLPVEFRLSR